MDQNSQPPQGGENQQGEPTRNIGPTGDYVPPQQPQQPQQGYPPQGAPPPGYQPQQPGYPPPGYQPQQPSGYPPQGYQQPGYPPGYQQPGYPPQPPARRGFPAWGWAVIVVFVILCVSCVAITAAGVSLVGVAGRFIPGLIAPLTTTTEFYAALGVGDYSKARTYLDSSLAAQYDEETLRTKWQALSTSGRNATFTMTNYSTQNDTATISGDLHTPNGTTPVEITLVKVGNDWKISGASPDLIPSP